MATYVRQSSFSDGDTITAALFNNEFNQLVNAFNVATGHTHDGSTAGDGGPISNLFSNALVFGTNTNNDVVITFNATSNDGVLTWMEDEDYFQFSDDLLLTTTEKVQFRDTAIYINSSTDGQLDIVADTEVQIAATTIDMNGNADISGNLGVGGNLTVTGTTTFNGGTITMGDAATDNVVFGADVDSNIIPDDDDSYDLGSSTQEWRNLYIDGTANIDSLVADTADINGGTIDAANITVGSGKTLDVSAGTLTLADNQISGDKVEGGTINATTINTLTYGSITDGTITVTAFVDEDNMASNSATLIPTQQSVKAYVDAQDTAQDLDLVSDSGTIAIDLDGETLTVTGGEGIDTSASSNTLTITGEDATTSNKGIASFNSDDFNVSSGAVTLATTSTAAELNILDGKAFLDEDDMSSNSATGIASQQSIKAYVDTQITAEDLDITTDSGTIAIDLDSETLTVSGGTGLDSSATGNVVTLAIDSTVATLTGSQTLTNKSLTAPTLTGTATVASLDISGDIDVDGTTNLDVVDIDGAVDMASTLAVGGNLTVSGADVTITGSVIHAGDADTYFGFHGADQWRVVTGGTERIEITNTEVVINDSSVDMDFRVESDSNANMLLVNGGNNSVSVGTSTSEATFTVGGSAVFNADSADADFRVESDSNTHMLFVDGGNNRVGINESSPQKPLHVNSGEGNIGIRVESTDETASIQFMDNGTTSSGTSARVGGISDDFFVQTNGVERFRIAHDGYGEYEANRNDIIRFTGANSGSITFRNDTSNQFVMHTGASDDFVIGTGGNNDRLTITSAGGATFNSTVRATKIGIGMAPTELLDIVSASGDARIRLDAPNGSDTEIKFFNAGAAVFTIGHDDGTGNFVIGGANVDDSHVAVGATGAFTTTPDAGAHAVFNEGSVDADFRVESNGKTHMLFVDGGNNRVGIMNSSPVTSLHIGDSSGAQQIRLESNGGGSSVKGTDTENNSNSGYTVGHITGTDRYQLILGTIPIFDMYKSNVVFNEGSVDMDFRIESNNSAYALYVDGGQDSVGILTNATDAALNVESQSGSRDGIRIVGSGGNNFITGYGNQGNISFSIDETGADDPGVLKLYRNGIASHILDPDAGGITVFNEQGEDVDFRVESSNNANILFIDASADTVNIGNTTDFGGILNVNGGLNSKQAVFTSTNNRGLALSTASRGGQNDGVAIIDAQDTESTGGRLELHTMGSVRASFERDQIIFNEGSNDQDFRVESNGRTSMLFVDGGNNAVGIGTNVTGNSTLEVLSTGVDGTFANAIGFQYSGNSSEANTISTAVSSNASLSGFKFNVSDGGGSSGKTNVAKFVRNEIVFNEDSNDQDFRIESNTKNEMFKVDGGNDIVNFNNNQTTHQLGAGYRADGLLRDFQRDVASATFNEGSNASTPSRTRRLIIPLYNYGTVKITIMNGGHLYNNGGSFGFRETTFYVAMESTALRVNTKIDGVNAGTSASSYGVPTAAAHSSLPELKIEWTVAAQMTCSTHVKVEGYGANGITSIETL